jgi:hypothetical protein
MAAQWHADQRGRRPKIAKLAANQALREYVQDRLAGAITRPGGVAVPGPDVRWIGRRHGRRADRRWARSGSCSMAFPGFLRPPCSGGVPRCWWSGSLRGERPPEKRKVDSSILSLTTTSRTARQPSHLRR